MNLNLYGHDNKWLMVDCGVSFDEPLVPSYLNGSSASAHKFDVVAPDPSFIAKQKENLVGIVITHAHEDHVGGLPYLWPRLKCPVYTTAFTAEVLRRKLAQVGLDGKVPIIEIDPLQTYQLGPFSLRWVSMTHSIPEPFALVIQTPLGKVLHTADWKIDPQPITGKPFDASLFKSLAEENILALVGDSTNANKPGFSISERVCHDGLKSIIAAKNHRVIVTCFGSNIARLISLAKIAQSTGRYMALIGRSLLNMYSIARQQGFWPQDCEIIDSAHIGYLPREEVLLVATGSQGESRAALGRLANDSHPHLALDSGDAVIFSSIVIPGNEPAVNSLLAKFNAMGVETVLSESSSLPIHASGHPCQDELKLMYHWVKPEIAIPVHGEDEHLAAHGQIAKQSGVQKHYVGRNGDVYLLAPVTGIRRQLIPVGRIPMDQS